MAWGAVVDVCRVGDITYKSGASADDAANYTYKYQRSAINAAIAAARDEQTVVLLRDIAKADKAANETRAISYNITIDGQGHSISRAFIVAAGKTLTLKDVTVSNLLLSSNSRTIMLNAGAKVVLDNATVASGVASCITIGMPKAASGGSTATIELKAGTNNTIRNFEGYNMMYGYNYNTSKKNGKIIITGDGALQVNHVGEAGYIFTGHGTNGGSFVIDAKNATFTAAEGHMFGSLATMTLSEGVYSEDPTSARVADGSVLLPSGDNFKVFAITGETAAANGVLATIDKATYSSFAAALEAAPKAALITLWADAPATTINQVVVINKNGFNAALTAGAGYAETVEDGYNVYYNAAADASEFAAFLAAEGEASYTLTEDIDIASAGVLPVNGTKTLTIPAGKKIYYQRQESNANIVVNEGATLTILGSGTFEPRMHRYTRIFNGYPIETSANAEDHMGSDIIYVYGNLVVGAKEDANNKPHFITSSLVQATAAIRVKSGGKAVFNNADMRLGCVSINNEQGGTTTIEGGEYISVSSSNNGVNNNWWSYNLQNYGVMTINGGHFQGTHGGFACQGKKISDDVNTGFAQDAVAFINGGSFETVHGKNFITGAENAKDNYYAMYVSNYGVVNVYDGNFKVQTPNAGANRVITIGNNDAYGAYGIVNFYGGKYAAKAYLTKQKNEYNTFPSSIPTTSAWYSTFQNKDDKNSYAPLPAGYEYYETNDATYPWGVRRIPGTETSEIASDETTIPWQQTSTWSTDVVPVTSTIVTIPADATVVVDKDFAGDAVAEQVFVNKGASLTIESGKALTVGDGGINIGFGGSVTVEPGATVKIGEAGIITAEENALVLESTEDAQAILLYDPAVKENTQPKATVKLTTKSKMLAGAPTWQYTYQRFAIPVKEAMIPANDFDPDHDELFPGEESYGFESYVYYWTGHNWATTNWSALVPFKGYQLANNSNNGGVTYTFNGNLIGNEDKAFEFQESGFDYFGNSYTAPINVESFLSGFGADVEATIWLYNYETKNWENIALEDFRDGFGVADEFKQIKSMDGFLLNLRAASGSAPVDYASDIWANPLLPSHAPARNRVTNDINNSVVITIMDNAGFGDKVTLVEKDNYTNAFENGADATKYILAEGVSLYAETQEGKLGRVATNDLDNTIISFRSGDIAEYTLTFGKVNGEDYLLRDNATGMTMAIAEGATYTFTQEANTTVPARFEIVGRHNAPTAIENVEAEAKAHGIYSIAGQFLGKDYTVLPAGVYVVNGVKIVK